MPIRISLGRLGAYKHELLQIMENTTGIVQYMNEHKSSGATQRAVRCGIIICELLMLSGQCNIVVLG